MAHVCLHSVLKKKKISKRQFGKLLKTDRATLRRFFRKDFNPKFATLAKWAKALGVSVKDLVED